MKQLPNPLPACFDPSVAEAGCDEAGRGCLAGPVYAAAVILPAGFSDSRLNDSKQVSERQRNELRAVIEAEAVAWAVGVVDNNEIDKINILRASILAMHRALDALAVRPEAVIVDGNRFTPYGNLPWRTFVKGDGRFANIAAASILAKTHRDAEMERLHSIHPMYGWNVNKGYPTRAHREAIRIHGATPLHRMSFRLLDNQPSLFGDDLQ
ncbi:MAG: ribonuclease HII [Firmicutes bacterium]|nr:ribonuclease HII [Bacillota bacterium]MCM1401043.1 ribonuclease HII [Bacteroides sp.]MCM1476962.1 ribonuclease HII [Bacteroides sp.]